MNEHIHNGLSLLPSNNPLAGHQRDQALETLQAQISNAANAPESSQAVGSLCRSLQTAIRSMTPYGQKAPPVVTVALRHLRDQPIDDQLWNQAVWKIEKQFAEYRFVLGPVLPPGLLEAVKGRIIKQAYDEGANASLDDDWNEYLRRKQNPQTGSYFPTGIRTLDDALGGGVSGLTFILGDKGVGKTWLAINTCLCSVAADDGVSVLFYTLDMDKTKVTDRMLGLQLGVPSRALGPMFHSENGRQQIIQNGLQSEFRSRIRLIERDFSWTVDHTLGTSERAGITVNKMWEDVRDQGNRFGTRRTLIVIDLFQKMTVPGGIPSTEVDQYRLNLIDEVRQKARRAWGDDSVAFLITSEMRKRPESLRSTRPTRDDMKGDGRLASDADNVLIFATEAEETNDVNRVCITIDKGRDGVERKGLSVLFQHSIGCFSPVRSQSEVASMPVEEIAPQIDPFAE